ncbi:MAG: hypothetical protein AAAFM81_13735 [Pseudomonadota bacterium]
MTTTNASLIGGDHCHQPLPSTLLPADPRPLTPEEIERLWQIFEAIGHAWENTVNDSVGLRSTWLEFVNLRAMTRPSYVVEYSNAIAVMDELFAIYGRDDAFKRLFFANGIPDGPPMTALAHAKQYVVNEFMSVQIASGGFRDFVAPKGDAQAQASFSINHRAYIAGSRYGRKKPVRAFGDDE